MNPISINEHAKLRDAASLLTERGISAAPVINDAGRPVGVLSRTDIIRFASGVSDTPMMLGDFIDEAKRLCDPKYQNSVVVRQVMTPKVLSVELDTSLADVAERMLESNVNRLFVIDQQETLVGVISALDVVRALTQ
jgi:CBS domain-containing protein